MKRAYCIPQTEMLKVYGTNDVLQLPDQPILGGSAGNDYNMAPARHIEGELNI